MMARIDIHIKVPRVEHEKLAGSAVAESSATVFARVQAARERQHECLVGTRLHCNADMGLTGGPPARESTPAASWTTPGAA
jgi:magnesium chelatase family protein